MFSCAPPQDPRPPSSGADLGPSLKDGAPVAQREARGEGPEASVGRAGEGAAEARWVGLTWLSWQRQWLGQASPAFVASLRLTPRP